MTNPTFNLVLERTEVAAVTASVLSFKRNFVKIVQDFDKEDEDLGGEELFDSMIMQLETIVEKLRPLLLASAQTFVDEFAALGISISTADMLGTENNPMISEEEN
jgi:hypothetical protein